MSIHHFCYILSMRIFYSKIDCFFFFFFFFFWYMIVDLSLCIFYQLLGEKFLVILPCLVLLECNVTGSCHVTFWVFLLSPMSFDLFLLLTFSDSSALFFFFLLLRRFFFLPVGFLQVLPSVAVSLLPLFFICPFSLISLTEYAFLFGIHWGINIIHYFFTGIN